MKKFLIDANLPSKVGIWQTDKFEFVNDINDEWSDGEIWDYAKINDLIIVTKDSDFSHRIISQDPPPKIIHIKIGNMRLNDFISFIGRNWVQIEEMSNENKLVNVFTDRIEAIK